ncbi:hypothetical protein EZS27_007768 [termite gut metagenome]|uniref:Uncharacterized protein n=1 Tax=termite gut metagenome TaxID=433724 RepID=A0A5J4SHC0_9ZZZZ
MFRRYAQTKCFAVMRRQNVSPLCADKRLMYRLLHKNSPLRERHRGKGVQHHSRGVAWYNKKVVQASVKNTKLGQIKYVFAWRKLRIHPQIS